MGRLVYSTGPDGPGERPSGRCERCKAQRCRCRSGGEPPGPRQPVRVVRERSGRRGKTVTTAGPLSLSRDEAKELLARLKRLCGSGGTLKGDRARFHIEIQGDHVARVVAELAKREFEVRRSGGQEERP